MSSSLGVTVKEGNMAATLEAHTPSHTPSMSSRAPSYWTSMTNIILRFLGIIFSLIAFSLMSAANNGANNGKMISYASFSALKYVIAVNVVACLYSVAQAVFFVISIVGCGWSCVPVPWLYYLTFSFDQALASLLLSSSSSGATAIDLIAVFQPDDLLSGFYSNAAGSVAMSFMATFVLGISAMLSGYHLVKNIL